MESILCTEELQQRPSRPPDHAKENAALVALASALAESRHTILEVLAETILRVTDSDSSGLSLLTSDGATPDAEGQRFYWPAIKGMWKEHVGGGTPRNFGPCGDVLDRNCTLVVPALRAALHLFAACLARGGGVLIGSVLRPRQSCRYDMGDDAQ